LKYEAKWKYNDVVKEIAEDLDPKEPDEEDITKWNTIEGAKTRHSNPK